ncbi:MAG: glycoside hydrolase family 5 protein, partial [Candidatus Hinthialibacter sp.]
MKRRDFLKTVPGIGAGMIVAGSSASAPKPKPTAAKLPRWRGFNLLEKFTLRQNRPYVERDFEWMAEWGFDFVRLPTDYRCWTDENDPYKLKEEVLRDIDQAVEWGKRYHIHVNLNLHRGPGYCVNPPEEPLDLWKDEEALKQFCFQWKSFSERYKGVPSDRLSFDLLNEPARIPEETYGRVVRAAVEAIRSADPERLVVADALEWGRKPVLSIADLGVAQSTR